MVGTYRSLVCISARAVLKRVPKFGTLGLAVNRDGYSCALRDGRLYGPFVGSGDIFLIELGVIMTFRFRNGSGTR